MNDLDITLYFIEKDRYAKFKVIITESMEIPNFKVRSVCISFYMSQLEKNWSCTVKFKYFI